MTQYDQRGQRVEGNQYNFVKNFFFWKIPDQKQELHNRKRMLERVHTYWIKGVLERSLHHFTLITLGLQEQPDAVAHPWQLIMHEFEQPDKILPSGTQITQVYDTVDGELLILGKPGSGKTTLLLELARELLNRATNDEQHPIPVIFRLPSWTLRHQPLAAWLVDELHTMYQINRKTGQTWVNDNKILPLLDGLDEIAENSRSACIEAINNYRKEHGLLPMVICSRTEEYLGQTERALLHSAIIIQPLTEHQIDEYISSGKEKLESLRSTLGDDQVLRELAETPLMLSVMAIVYSEGPIEELINTDSIELRRQQVFSRYVQRVFKRERGLKNEYMLQQVIHWLSWLAKQMLQHNQTDFYLERMQPNWLTDQQLSTYRSISNKLWTGHFLIGIFVVLGVLLGGLPNTFSSKLFGTLSGGLSNVWIGAGACVVIGLFAGLYLSRRKLGTEAISIEQLERITQIGQIKTAVENMQKDQQNIDPIARQWSMGCFVFALWVLFGALSTILISTRPGALFGVLLYVVSSWIIRAVVFAMSIQTIKPFLLPQMTLMSLAPLALPIDVLVGALLGTFVGLFLPIIPTELVGGLGGVLIGIFITTASGPTDDITIELAEVYRLPSWDKLVEKGRAIDDNDVLTALFVGLAIGVFVVLQAGFIYGILSGILAAVVIFVLFKGFVAISSERLAEEHLIKPNQGFWLSFRNSILLGVFIGIACGVVFWAISGKILAGIVIGVFCGLVFWMRRGGGACVDYLLLRWLLLRSGTTPKNYTHFLDYAVGRVLLYKVGGGYIFIHRALRDYFATLENVPPPQKKAKTTIFRVFRLGR